MLIKYNDFLFNKAVEIFGKDLIQNVYLTNIDDEDRSDISTERQIDKESKHIESINFIPNQIEGEMTFCILFKNGRLIQFNMWDDSGIYLVRDADIKVL